MLIAHVQQANTVGPVLGVTLGAFAIGEVTRTLRLRPGASHTNLGAELLFRAVFFGCILLLPIGRALAPDAEIGGGDGMVALGAGIAWFGLLLRWWSFVALGKYFTVVLQTSQDQRVVDRGPYRVLRHPSYAGLLLAFLGCGLMLGNAVSTASSVTLLLLALVHRIGIEEQALEAALGNDYRAFAASRARLVPFVW